MPKTTKTHANEIVTVKLKDLNGHPLQREFYDDCTDEDDEAVRRDIEAHGVRDPITVLPAGNAAGLPANTVLDGHRRIRILSAMGHKQIKAMMRYDLLDADRAIVTASSCPTIFSDDSSINSTRPGSPAGSTQSRRTANGRI